MFPISFLIVNYEYMFVFVLTKKERKRNENGVSCENLSNDDIQGVMI